MVDKFERCPFKKGDILKNKFAGENNPYRYVMFLKCGTIRQGKFSNKSYDCMGYDGKKAQFFRDDNQFECVGHLKEFDIFLAELKKLKGLKMDGGKSG